LIGEQATENNNLKNVRSNCSYWVIGAVFVRRL
ncbi:unnamed protein product, partial [marine sediment metagenome]